MTARAGHAETPGPSGHARASAVPRPAGARDRAWRGRRAGPTHPTPARQPCNPSRRARPEHRLLPKHSNQHARDGRPGADREAARMHPRWSGSPTARVRAPAGPARSTRRARGRAGRCPARRPRRAPVASAAAPSAAPRTRHRRPGWPRRRALRPRRTMVHAAIPGRRGDSGSRSPEIGAARRASWPLHRSDPLQPVRHARPARGKWMHPVHNRRPPAEAIAASSSVRERRLARIPWSAPRHAIPPSTG